MHITEENKKKIQDEERLRILKEIEIKQWSKDEKLSLCIRSRIDRLGKYLELAGQILLGILIAFLSVTVVMFTMVRP